jgi:translation initiation factor IF-3
VTHPERGVALLDKLAGELADLAVVEQSPVQDGRNMTMLLAPSKSVLAGEHDKPADGDQDTVEAAGDGASPASDNGSSRANGKSTSGTSGASLPDPTVI